MAQRKKEPCNVSVNDKVFKKIKHEGRKHKYKRKIKMLQEKVQSLQQALEREQSTYNLLWDACDARGLICGICLEDIVQQSALPCCSNSMCKVCEDQVAEKHQCCPFCRAPMTPPQSVLDKQRAQQQQQQQQPNALHDYFHAIRLGHMPADDADSDAPHSQHQHSAMAALQGFLAQHLALSLPSGAACPEEDLSGEEGYDDYGSEGGEAGEGYEGMEQPHWNGTDHTVLYAAAAEAVAAARAGPSSNCGLCDERFLLASLASTEELPGILVCRHCWRNMPGLSDTPFPAGQAAPAAAAAAGGGGGGGGGERFATAGVEGTANPRGPSAPAAAAAAFQNSLGAQPTRAAAAGSHSVPAAAAGVVGGSSKSTKHMDKQKRKQNTSVEPKAAAYNTVGRSGSGITSSHHRKRERQADTHNATGPKHKKQQGQQQPQQGGVPLKKKAKKAVTAAVVATQPAKKVAAAHGCGVAAPSDRHGSKKIKNKQKSLPGHKARHGRTT